MCLFPTASSCVFVFPSYGRITQRALCVTHTQTENAGTHLHRMTCSFHHPERSYSLVLFPLLLSFPFSLLSLKFIPRLLFPASQTALRNALATRRRRHHAFTFGDDGRIRPHACDEVKTSIQQTNKEYVFKLARLLRLVQHALEPTSG